jgi:predicted AlkP superfamily pyrophosphatase or phosphodiesterase
MRNLLISFAVSMFFSACSAQVKSVKHVVFIGLDGVGAYALKKGGIPTLQRMMDEGAHSLEARSCLPSSSAINWASHFMGAGPELHGYTRWNTAKPDHEPRAITSSGMFPTIFYVMKTQQPGKELGVVYEWDGIGNLFERKFVDADIDCTGDDATVQQAAQYIKRKKPNLLAIHLNGPDAVGHNIGFQSPEYYAQLTKTDRHVAEIIEAVKQAGIYNETLFIVSSDHGGLGKEHGGNTMTEMQVPWIVYGKAVRKKGVISESIMVYDTAATIAWLFGLKQPQVWIGRPVKSPF